MTVWHDATAESAARIDLQEEVAQSTTKPVRLTWRMIGALSCAALAATAAYFLN
jgi:hypothetical protein